MNVLSLFDGISCCRLALDKAEIKVEKYYRAEIDKYANIVADANYPDSINLGDVTKWKEWDIDWSSIDLVTAGFPCQSWSVAGHQMGDKDPRGALFWMTLDIIKKVISSNPKAKWLMENVKMKSEFEQYITHHTKDALGDVNKVLINSALVSAQNRKRFYWSNFEIKEINSEYSIDIIDIIDCDNISAFQIKQSDFDRFKITNKDNYDRQTGQIGTTARNGSIGQRDRVYGKNGKMITLTSTIYKQPPQFMLNDKVYKLTPIMCERLQTIPDNYTNHASKSQRYKMIGNAWTVDVIAHIFKCM